MFVHGGHSDWIENTYPFVVVALQWDTGCRQTNIQPHYWGWPNQYDNLTASSGQTNMTTSLPAVPVVAKRIYMTTSLDIPRPLIIQSWAIAQGKGQSGQFPVRGGLEPTTSLRLTLGAQSTTLTIRPPRTPNNPLYNTSLLVRAVAKQYMRTALPAVANLIYDQLTDGCGPTHTVYDSSLFLL